MHAIALKTAAEWGVECVLSATDNFTETLTLRTIRAQPGLIELVIRTQLRTAKNQAERRVKSHTCVDRQALLGLQKAIRAFLDNPTAEQNA